MTCVKKKNANRRRRVPYNFPFLTINLLYLVLIHVCECVARDNPLTPKGKYLISQWRRRASTRVDPVNFLLS